MTTIGYDATPLLGQKSGVGHYTKRLIAAIMSLEPQWCYQLYTNRPLGELDEGLRRAMEIDTYLPASRWLWMQLVLPRVQHRPPPDPFHYTTSIHHPQPPPPSV